MIKTLYLFCVMMVILTPGNFCSAQENSLREQISAVIREYPGEVGIAMYHLSNGDTLSIHGTTRYPMQSVFKFPIALAVFNAIDKGKYALDEKVLVKKEEIVKNTWSPLGKLYPDGEINVTIKDLLMYMVRDSDNNACDILLRVLGGPKVVEQYVREAGISNIAIRYTEREMEKSWDAQFSNWSDPRAMAYLLKKFYDKELLAPASQALLWDMMVATSTGLHRLKGLIPAVTIAHRTGTSGINDGMMAAINDSGIIQVSDKSFVILAVFVTKAPEPMSSGEEIIARIAKTVYDYYRVR